MKKITETPVPIEEKKLADIETRISDLEAERADANAAREAANRPEPRLEELSLEQLTAPAVATVAIVATREPNAIEKDIARMRRAAELQLEVLVKAKTTATRAAVAEMEKLLPSIVAEAASKLHEAEKIIAKADAVFAQFQAAGYGIDCFSDDPQFRAANVVARNFVQLADAMKIPQTWYSRMRALNLLK